MLLERIKILLDEHSMTIAELERKMDFGQGSMSRWKVSNPSVDKVQKVADYFHVSIDYLQGRTDNRFSGMSDEQQNLTIEAAINAVKDYQGKELSNNDKEVLIRIAKAYLNQNN